MDDFSFSLANDEIMEIATNFVEKYVDFVENLPFDLQRLVTRLREIDCACRGTLICDMLLPSTRKECFRTA